MEFRILGPVELRSAGKQHDLGTMKERCILAILLLKPRTLVSAETLIYRLWDTEPPAKAREDLSTYVSRIRRRLRYAVGDQVRLDTRRGGYVLDVDPETVDLYVFRRRIRQARALARSGEADRAVVLLREAEGLWRGEALSALAGDSVAWLRRSLEEERRAVVLERLELELRLGRHIEIVGELHELTSHIELNEVFTAYYMLALYRCGRLADAVRAYAHARRRLVEEQGTEPGPELSSLHQRILRRDPELAVVARADRADTAVPDTLPPSTSNFVGRSREIRLLSENEHRERNASVRIIEGMAGVGKTTLAVHFAHSHAHRYPDGRLYLSFRSHLPGQIPLSPTEAAQRLLEMLHMRAEHIPSHPEERSELWRQELARRRMIVIFDDVLGAEQLQSIMPTAGDSLILITSRRRLDGIPGARALTVPALPAHDALAMFTSIVGRERADDLVAAAEVVRLCAGLPLAIQLTAARVREDPSVSLAVLVEDLSRGSVPAGDAAVADKRLTQAFELSYVALTPSRRRSFRRLGVHPCAEMTVHAVAALEEVSFPEAEDVLATLVGHHLVEHSARGSYRCHDLIRAYARSRALCEDPEPERRRAVSRVLDYYTHTTDQADRILYPHRRPPAVADSRLTGATPVVRTREAAQQWLESEWRNIVEAARYAARHEWQRQCATLAHFLAGFLDTGGYWNDAIDMHETALTACRELDDPAGIARASLDLSLASQQTGRYEKATRHADDAADIYRDLGDRQGEAQALDRLGIVRLYSARYLEALAYYQEARSAYHDVGDRHGIAETLIHAGSVCWRLGRQPEAVTQLDEALSLYRMIGDRRGEAKTLNNIGEIQRYRGLYRDAVESYQQALAIFEEIGGRQNHALLHHNMGIIHQYKGDCEKALAAYRYALATYRDTGDRRNQAGVLNDIGITYQFMEQYEEAFAHHQRALEIAETIGERYEQVIAVRGLADARRGTGNYAEAIDRYEQILSLAREIGDPYQEAKVLAGIATAMLHMKRRDTARIYLRQALGIFERLGVPEAQEVKLRLQTIGVQAS